ncbi:MAG: flagellar motor protein PomA [Gammaproteobacteria bacterium]|nr:flagellar motor protein PomA [Gammaproteobacteria bacterium]
MDLATLIGLIGGFAVVLTSIMLGGSASTFINVPSLAVVFGGTILVTMMKFSLGEFLGAASIAVKAFLHKPSAPEALIEKAVELAKTARQGGLLALEDAEVPDEFMKNGLGLLIDGHPADVVRSMLTKDKNLTLQRHNDGQSIFKAIGDVGPAMGMIGTLIGLVQMLSNMDDPKQIGPAMAVALLTTLYGAILATMFALPIADKLGLRSREENITKSLVIDALLGIQGGQNPRVIESMLETYLPKSKRQNEDTEE